MWSTCCMDGSFYCFLMIFFLRLVFVFAVYSQNFPFWVDLCCSWLLLLSAQEFSVCSGCLCPFGFQLKAPRQESFRSQPPCLANIQTVLKYIYWFGIHQTVFKCWKSSGFLCMSWVGFIKRYGECVDMSADSLISFIVFGQQTHSVNYFHTWTHPDRS